jgi:hypothetical protein
MLVEMEVFRDNVNNKLVFFDGCFYEVENLESGVDHIVELYFQGQTIFSGSNVELQ